jgi:hypothetical protein
MAADALPDFHLLDTGQFCARWRYERAEDAGMFDVHDAEDVVGGYPKIDNITDEALVAFLAAYPDESISKDDIFDYVYALLTGVSGDLARLDHESSLRRVALRSTLVRWATPVAMAVVERLRPGQLGWELAKIGQRRDPPIPVWAWLSLDSRDLGRRLVGVGREPERRQ